MDLEQLGPQTQKHLEEIAGYLNFSSGLSNPRFLASVNALFALVELRAAEGVNGGTESSRPEPTWRALRDVIRAGLDQLRARSEAFRQIDQAEAVVGLVFDQVLPAYPLHHRDLLFHQTEAFLFQPFFLGRACEAVLAEGGPWHESDRIVAGALKRLNDFIGHRPVAVLRTEQKLQPYGHEWVRPIPVYIAGAGVATGPYHDLIEETLELLRSTDRGLLDRAWFDPALMDELSVDPRAYDFDHPVNRRPNYHFGGWDPHLIDNQGRYRRFVVQQVTLDALLGRFDEPRHLAREELLFEGAAVLAGTMLMGSGITGSGPDSHDSSTSLATLLPMVAAYRDTFYEQLLARLSGARAERLRAEATALRQPFGGARQHLNHSLARRRAEQLQHVHLSRLFARMGYSEAATRQARVVPVASARMRCEMECRLSAAHLQIDRGRLDAAAAVLPEIEDFLHRAIECGAMVDPWNILGFGGQFSLFPAVENSVYDHRIDELLELINEFFGLYARLEKEAAAAGQTELHERLSDDLRALTRWWDRFATTQVSGVEGVSGRQAWQSASQVSKAIAAWHKAGTAAGDVAFWREHVERFHSPEAFAMLAETLLDRRDFVASMALLMVWLGQAEQIPLAEGAYSFHALALRWMDELWGGDEPAASRGGSPSRHDARPDPRWSLTRKFLDYLEANAEEYWQVPRLELLGSPEENGSTRGREEEETAEGLFGAAYENVTYRDTTDDGFDGEMLEGGSPATDFELSLEAERISKHLALLAAVARLWKVAAAASTDANTADGQRDEVLASWLSQARDNHRALLDLLSAVHRYRIPPPGTALEAMIEYDRRRGIKEALLERIIATCVETGDAGRFLLATMEAPEPATELDDWELPVQRVVQAVFHGDRESARQAWPELLEALAERPLLYIPVSRAGNPERIVASRSIHRVLRRLLAHAPRLGLLAETYQLMATIQSMEREHPVGPGAVTEFDRLFEIGCEGIVECLVASSEDWTGHSAGRPGPGGPADLALVDCLERATERLLQCWLAHSRNIRISVLETVADERRWRRLKKFIRHYGHDLFTQQFMNFGNLRAILHQGVDAYLDSLAEESEEPLRLVEDRNRGLLDHEAPRWLEVTVEAVVESYSEYIDYNSTTTQSDRGEMLYTLLDFLRLQASYDRVAWNLKPVIIAHEVMVRRGRSDAARIWQRAVVARSEALAEDHLRRFEQMVKRYGMRLPSVAERLGERFVRPLEVDRLRALVRPAVEELREGGSLRSFKRLEREVARFTREPSGVGFDVPSWLEALEREAEQVRTRSSESDEPADPAPYVPQTRLSLEDVERQLETWEEEPGI